MWSPPPPRSPGYPGLHGAARAGEPVDARGRGGEEEGRAGGGARAGRAEGPGLGRGRSGSRTPGAGGPRASPRLARPHRAAPGWRVIPPPASLTPGPARRRALTGSAGGTLKPSASVEGAQAVPPARDPAVCARDRAGPPAARPALLGHQPRPQPCWPRPFADAPFAAPRPLPRAARTSAAIWGQAEAESPTLRVEEAPPPSAPGTLAKWLVTKPRARFPGRGVIKSTLFTRLSHPARLILRHRVLPPCPANPELTKRRSSSKSVGRPQFRSRFCHLLSRRVTHL